MSSSVSTPLPPLPTEVKKEILKFCDQPTLAKTSSLSLAFLQLSSPLLYRHIVFEGPEGLTKFLTIVAEKRHPELELWLDLSLVQSVTYVDAEDNPFTLKEWDGQRWQPSIEPFRLHLPSSPTPGRLPLHSLKVVLPATGSETRIDDLFDPVEFQLNGGYGEYTSCLNVDLSSWTRLRRLVFVDAFFGDFLLNSKLRRSSAQGLDIFYDLLASFSPSVTEWIDGDLNVEAGSDYGAGWPYIEKVTVLLSTHEDKEVVLESLEGSLLLPRITMLVKSSIETDVDSA